MVVAVILAGGKGTRMGLGIPKCCVKINDKEMINILTETIEKTIIEKIVIIVGYKAEEVVKATNYKYIYCYQEKQIGTANALMCAKNQIKQNDEIIVFLADMPFISQEIITDLINYHKSNENDITLVTNTIPNPKGYGRIVYNNHKFKIIEEKEANEEIKKINIINTGLFIGKAKIVFDLLKEIDNNNSSREYYLTNIFNIDNNYKIETLNYINNYHLLGINTFEDLVFLKSKLYF